MAEFFIKYWIEFLFGLVALAITGYLKLQYSNLQKMKGAYESQEKDNYLEEVYLKIDEIKESLEIKMDDLENKIENFSEALNHVRDGILAVQYDRLNYMCMKCLKAQKIVERDYLNIQQLYKSYKENGGNHGMDQVYDLTIKLPLVERYGDEEV